MDIKILTKNNQAIGYTTVGYSSSDEEEVIISTSEQEITNILLDLLDNNETWQDKFMYISLDNEGNMYLDLDKYKEVQKALTSPLEHNAQ